MCVGSWACTYLRYTVSMIPNKDETAVHCCNPALSVLVTFGASKLLSRSISLAVYFLYLANSFPVTSLLPACPFSLQGASWDGKKGDNGKDQDCLIGSFLSLNIPIYYINTSDIPGEISRVNISSCVKVTTHVIFKSEKITIAMFLYGRAIVGSSSELSVFFGNLRQSCIEHFRKMFGKDWLAFGQILENLRKSSENRQKGIISMFV